MAFRAAIFDVDGVLVDSPHEAAWREALRELMEGEWAALRASTTWSPDGFTSLVYQQHVSGKPRMSGARSALEHFGIPANDEHLATYGARKQRMIERLIDAGDFTAFDDAVRFVVSAKEAGLALAAASSSRNAGRFMRAVHVPSGGTLLEMFDVDVSGRDFEHGKPHPEMFLAAAAELGVDPRSAVVFEDAPAGVAAAKAGGMDAVGIARYDDAQLLTDAGADLVVASFDELDPEYLRTQGG